MIAANQLAAGCQGGRWPDREYEPIACGEFTCHQRSYYVLYTDGEVRDAHAGMAACAAAACLMTDERAQQ
jgi:hypothetical protein